MKMRAQMEICYRGRIFRKDNRDTFGTVDDCDIACNTDAIS